MLRINIKTIIIVDEGKLTNFVSYMIDGSTSPSSLLRQFEQPIESEGQKISKGFIGQHEVRLMIYDSTQVAQRTRTPNINTDEILYIFFSKKKIDGSFLRTNGDSLKRKTLFKYSVAICTQESIYIRRFVNQILAMYFGKSLHAKLSAGYRPWGKNKSTFSSKKRWESQLCGSILSALPTLKSPSGMNFIHFMCPLYNDEGNNISDQLEPKLKYLYISTFNRIIKNISNIVSIQFLGVNHKILHSKIYKSILPAMRNHPQASYSLNLGYKTQEELINELKSFSGGSSIYFSNLNDFIAPYLDYAFYLGEENKDVYLDFVNMVFTEFSKQGCSIDKKMLEDNLWHDYITFLSLYHAARELKCHLITTKFQALCAYSTIERIFANKGGKSRIYYLPNKLNNLIKDNTYK